MKSRMKSGREVLGARRQAWIASVAVAVLCLPSSLPADEFVYVDVGSAGWRFLPGVAEASEPDPTTWRLPEFDDGAWTVVATPIGYGRGRAIGTDLGAFDPPMMGVYNSFFLRRTFEVPILDEVETLRAEVRVDDGLIVWINGQELGRVGMLEEPEFFAHDAEAARGVVAIRTESIESESPLDFLVEGTNTIAVQLFNSRITNRDALLDLRLLNPFGPDRTAPAVGDVRPVPEATLRRLTEVRITFTEAVLGVDAADLLVAGVPASAVSGTAAGPYTFSFVQPADGEVRFEWSADHGITDATPLRNPLTVESWTYTLALAAPFPQVRINEVLLINRGGLEDANFEEQAWIELFNAGGNPVDLLGWTLTADPDEPEMWRFPSVVLGAGEYLVIFASGKDRVDPEELHTNFTLDIAELYVALYTGDIPGQLVDELAAEVSEHRDGISYGVDSGGAPSYLFPPTPGEDNDTAATLRGILPRPLVSPEPGFYDQSFDVTITANPGLEVRYTLDGSPPDLESPLYERALEIEGTTTLRATSFGPGFVPSLPATRTYLFPDDIVEQDDLTGSVRGEPDFPERMKEALRQIPSLSIVMSEDDIFGSQGSYNLKVENPTSVELLHPDGRAGFQIDCGIERHSNAPNKTSLRLLFKREFGPEKLRYPFFETAALHAEGAVESFDRLVLRSGKNQSWPNGRFINLVTYLEDQWVRDSQLAMSGIGSHGMFVHLFINGTYWGLYNPVERPDAWFTSAYFGGDKEDYLATNFGVDAEGVHISGDPSRFDEAIALADERNLEDTGNYERFQQLLDVQAFADYVILFWFSGFGDGVENNWYGGMRMNPPGPFQFYMWDGEFVFLSTAGPPGNNSAWVPGYFFDTSLDHTSMIRFWQAVHENREFRVLFADRVYEHCFNDGALTDANSRLRLQILAEGIDKAILGEAVRWGGSRTPEIWRSAVETLDAKMNTNVATFIEALRARPDRDLYPLIDPPIFNQHGGDIEPGFLVSLSLAEGGDGTVYFTTDGSDPRFPGSEEVALTAQLYTGPFALAETTVVRTRQWRDGVWSALHQATFAIGAATADVVVSEIHYNPSGGAEFVELHNPGDLPLSLAGWEFTSGVTFVFADDVVLAPGDYLVLANSAEEFLAVYPDVSLAGAYRGRLANDGEKVTLKDAAGDTAFTVEYNDAGFWPLGADGFGYSLVLADLDRDPDDPRAWRQSASVDGSPGEADSEPLHGGVVINEVRVDGTAEENGVELINLTPDAVDIGGWYLSDSRADEAALKRFAIPDGTVIPPEGLVAFAGTGLSFSLPQAGGGVYLASAASAELTGHIVGVRFEAGESGGSFGRFETSDGLDLATLSSPTLGTPNAPPRPAEIAINEIHYHPLEGGIEFLELFNPGVVEVSLSGWSVDGIRAPGSEEDFVFPAGVRIPPGGFLLLVPDDPDAFRFAVVVPPEVPVLGPYDGALSNGGEQLRLLKPVPELPGAAIVVDRVRYNDREPWPVAADGDGGSLERRRAADFGNEPLSWDVSRIPGGTPGRVNSVSSPVEPPPSGGGVPGDFDRDNRLDLMDAILLLERLFRDDALELPCEGTLANDGNRDLLDADGNGRLNVGDPLYLLEHLFRDGPAHVLGSDCQLVSGCESGCE